MTDLSLGQYQLIEFKLDNGVNSLDIKNLVQLWNIIEDMNAGFLSGSARIKDTNNLIQAFPLQGEEKLTIRYVDYFGVELVQEAWLYSVTSDSLNFKVSDEEQNYTIYFCSIGRILSATQNVMIASDGPVSDFADSLFTRYFSDLDTLSETKKEIHVTETQGDQRLVVPSYSPIEAMHFLSRYAYDDQNSSAFRFFESREKYYFAPPEELARLSQEKIEEDKLQSKMTFTIFAGLDFVDNGGPDARMAEILDLNLAHRVNTIDDINKGAYNRKVIDISVIDKGLQKTETVFPRDVGQYFPEIEMHTRHSQKFVDAFMRPSYDVFVLSDHGMGCMRPNPRQDRLHGSKSMQLIHDKSNELELTIYGRNFLTVGDTITLSIPTFVSREGQMPEIDEERSGRYIVSAINNEFAGDIYKQILKVTRTGQPVEVSISEWEQIPNLTPEENIPNSGSNSDNILPPKDGDSTTNSDPNRGADSLTAKDRELDRTSIAELEADPTWEAKMAEMEAKYPGLSRDDIYRIIQGESKFVVRDVNSIGATGLFQFTEGAAGDLGYTTSQIGAMTPTQQLQVYDEYLAFWKYNPANSLGIVQGAPKYASKPASTVVYDVGSAAWRQNPGWRPSDGGPITVGSMNDYYNKQGLYK